MATVWTGSNAAVSDIADDAIEAGITASAAAGGRINFGGGRYGFLTAGGTITVYEAEGNMIGQLCKTAAAAADPGAGGDSTETGLASIDWARYGPLIAAGVVGAIVLNGGGRRGFF